MCRTKSPEVEAQAALHDELERTYPRQWQQRAAEPKAITGSLFVSVPRWDFYSRERDLDQPPLVELVLGSGTSLGAEYTVVTGVHKAHRLGDFRLENFLVDTIHASSYTRLSAVPVKLVSSTGKVVASLCEEGHGEQAVFSAYAVDMLGTSRAASKHRSALVGLLDVHRGILAVRDVESPLGKAVLFWLLLRCIGMDCTGIAHTGASFNNGR
jgi:hypothetical protein